MMNKTNLPQAGDIVLCKTRIVNGFSKVRPAIVLQEGDDRDALPVIKVALGSYDNTDIAYAGQFVIATRMGRAFEKTGLLQDTKFDFNKTIELPFNEEFFEFYTDGATIGSVHPSIVRHLQVVYDVAKRMHSLLDSTARPDPAASI